MAANRPPPIHQSDPSTSKSHPSSISRTRPSRASTRKFSTTTTSAADDGDEIDLDGIECSRGCCKSCVAGAIADGVAICCCPCAVLDLVAFLLVRVPWMVGRRCLKMARGKRKGKRRIAECGGSGGGGNGGGEARRRSSGMGRNHLERWRVSEGMIEVTTSFKFEDEDNEEEEADERVWLELCRGFGRLSFTGIQSAGKGSLVNFNIETFSRIEISGL